MILIWTSNLKIKAILRSGEVRFLTLEEVERIAQSKYDSLKARQTLFHLERLKSQIDHLEMFMKRKLTRVALCV